MTTYSEVRDQAMRDLVRDPRQVVYAADEAIEEERAKRRSAQRLADRLEAALTEIDRHPNSKLSKTGEAYFALGKRDAAVEIDELQAEVARLRTVLLSTLRIHSGVLVNITDTVSKAAAAVETALQRERGGGT